MDSVPQDATLYPAVPLLDRPVSLFQGSRNTIPVACISLGVVLDRIQNGTYQQTVERLRQILASGDQEAYRAAKEHSTAFTPGCALHTRAQKTLWDQKLISCTGLVYFDLDHLHDPEALKHLLAQQPYVAFAFVSPSAHGLKIGLAASGIGDSDSYKHAWAVTLAHLKQTYPAVHFNEDRHVKFLNALCYVSYDPALFVNPAAQPYAVPPPMITPAPPPRPVFTTTIPSDRRAWYAQRGLTKAAQMIAESVPGQQHYARCRAAYLLGGYVAGGLLPTAEAEAALTPAVEATAQDTKRAMRDITDCLAAGEAKPITLAALEEDWQQWRQQQATTWHTRATRWTGQFQAIRAEEIPSWHS